jgi:hypothetical protein
MLDTEDGQPPRTAPAMIHDEITGQPRKFYATRELASPSTDEERAAIAGEIVREYVREARVPAFEE